MSTLLDVRVLKDALQERARAPKLVRVLEAIEDAATNAPAYGVVEERFRQIAARCLDVKESARSQSLAISSATSGEGKSSVAIGIAIAAAQNFGSDVLIVETDMQRPQLANDFNLDVSPGLSEFLGLDVDVTAIVQPTRIPHVWLLPAGRPTTNPGPLLRSRKFGELMATLHAMYQTLIVDTPPLLTSPHAAVIANHTQGVVLVARAGRTHVHDAAAAVKAAGPVPVRGFVLNGTKVWLPRWLTRLFGLSPLTVD